MVTFQQIRDSIESKDWDSLTKCYTEAKTYGFNPPLDAKSAERIRNLMLECALFGPDGSHGFPRVLLNALDDVVQQAEPEIENDYPTRHRIELIDYNQEVIMALAIIDPVRRALVEPTYDVDPDHISMALDLAAERLWAAAKRV